MKLKIDVRLLWSQEETTLRNLYAGMAGVYAETSFEIDYEDFMEKVQLDEEEIFTVDNIGEIREYTELDQDTFNKIEIYLNEGGLPVGIPICSIMGMPEHIYFTNMNVIEEEEL